MPSNAGLVALVVLGVVVGGSTHPAGSVARPADHLVAGFASPAGSVAIAVDHIVAGQGGSGAGAGATIGDDPDAAPPRLAGRMLWERGAISRIDATRIDASESGAQRTVREVPGSTTTEGFEVAGGTARAGDGPTVRYTVEREDVVDVELSGLVASVEAALHDPRSWANDHTLERIDDPDAADIRILLATPGTVDALCREAGLDTAGRYSCWNGRFAALNVDRWEEGAAPFDDDLDTYRRYLVNHEFGHGLGYGHVGCPAPGEPAPLMMQQSKGTAGCEPNGWAYPHLAEESDDTA